MVCTSIDGNLVVGLLHHLPGPLAQHGADFALQIADPRLARVGVDQLHQRAVFECDLRFFQPLFRQLLGNEKLSSDGQLLQMRIGHQDLSLPGTELVDGMLDSTAANENAWRACEASRDVNIEELLVSQLLTGLPDNVLQPQRAQIRSAEAQVLITNHVQKDHRFYV